MGTTAATTTRRFEGRTVFITGGARGQGRSHAVSFAREGADVVLADVCADLETIPYPLAGPEDLAETVRLCEREGAEVIAAALDVRDYDSVDELARAGLERFGKLDVLVANAGALSYSPLTEMSAEQFDEMIGINLKGVWHSIKAVVPSMRARRYGRVVVTGSIASLVGLPNLGHYCASKHAVLGLTKSLALEEAENGITANCVCPGTVHTSMVDHESSYAVVSPENPTVEGMLPILASINAIQDPPWMEPRDISAMVLFLASDEARFITGSEMKVDMGITAR